MLNLVCECILFYSLVLSDNLSTILSPSIFCKFVSGPPGYVADFLAIQSKCTIIVMNYNSI